MQPVLRVQSQMVFLDLMQQMRSPTRWRERCWRQFLDGPSQHTNESKPRRSSPPPVEIVKAAKKELEPDPLFGDWAAAHARAIRRSGHLRPPARRAPHRLAPMALAECASSPLKAARTANAKAMVDIDAKLPVSPCRKRRSRLSKWVNSGLRADLVDPDTELTFAVVSDRLAAQQAESLGWV